MSAEGPSRWSDADRAALERLGERDPSALPWSDWAMRPTAVEEIVAEIARREAPRVLELGAGVSSVLAARALREPGGSLVAVEHDPAWAEKVAELLAAEGLESTARIAVAPLSVPAPEPPLVLPAAEYPPDWYEEALVREAVAAPFDLLVVDGPPAGDRPELLVRAPALTLAELLAPDAVVFLDDVSRPAERRTAGLWAELLDRELLVDERADLAILRPT